MTYGLYTEEEIISKYKRNPTNDMITILSQLCCVSKNKIREIVGIGAEEGGRSEDASSCDTNQRGFSEDKQAIVAELLKDGKSMESIIDAVYTCDKAISQYRQYIILVANRIGVPVPNNGKVRYIRIRTNYTIKQKIHEMIRDGFDTDTIAKELCPLKGNVNLFKRNVMVERYAMTVEEKDKNE